MKILQRFFNKKDESLPSASMTPAMGYSLIIEDNKDALKGKSSLREIGFDAGDPKKAGVTGVIIGSTPDKDEVQQFSVGDHVIFSKFIAEHLTDILDSEGNEIENLRAVPNMSILAIIHDRKN